MIQRREDLFAQCVDDLRMTADTLSRCAVELHAASHGLEAENPERLRQQAIGLQAESMRAAMAALTARAVSERLATVARIDAATEVPTE